MPCGKHLGTCISARLDFASFGFVPSRLVGFHSISLFLFYSNQQLSFLLGNYSVHASSLLSYSHSPCGMRNRFALHSAGSFSFTLVYFYLSFLCYFCILLFDFVSFFLPSILSPLSVARLRYSYRQSSLSFPTVNRYYCLLIYELLDDIEGEVTMQRWNAGSFNKHSCSNDPAVCNGCGQRDEYHTLCIELSVLFTPSTCTKPLFIHQSVP